VRVIFGIGNPGKRYLFNRHNVGFQFLDFLSENLSLKFIPSKKDFFYTEGELQSSPFLFIKPAVYVNNSGLTALQVFEKYNILPQDLLVVSDDINLPLGNYKVRLTGGDGGHNGLHSIIYHLNSNQFPRIRIGVGSAFEKGKMIEYVLGDFNKEEQEILADTFKKLEMLIRAFITGGSRVMLDENSKIKKSENLK